MQVRFLPEPPYFFKFVFAAWTAAFCHDVFAAEIRLAPDQFRHITFDKITPTIYTSERETLRMHVDRSSSFLLRAFDAPQVVTRVIFEWKSEGDLKVADAAQEQSKGGDDSRLRIALIQSGDPPLVPFFAPAWVKAIRDYMKTPGNRLLYLTAGARAKPGSIWGNPYNSDIESVAVVSKPTADGWQQVRHDLSSPTRLAGFWIMADGDNTQSVFTSWVRSLSFE